MSNINVEINEFLMSLSMHPDLTDIENVTHNFLIEMKKGLKGEVSSLKMLPTYISVGGSPSDEVPVIAIDAGGTNLRVGLVKFKFGKPMVWGVRKYEMPGSRGEISSHEFFNELADKILPLTSESNKIGFCFSYPVEINPFHDGKILCLTKEVCIKNSEGLMIGEELIKRLNEKGVNKNIKLTVLNDSVAGLLGGLSSFSLEDFDGISGLILGTGYNNCYLEKGENIEKLNNAKSMVINCEAGNFSKVLRGISDEKTDSDSENSGDYLLEKMLGGVYHGKVITNTLILASKMGIISNNFKNITEPFTNVEFDDFLRGRDNRIFRMCKGDDASILREIIDMSYERAAKLICANIAALCIQCDGGKREERPFCVVVEGAAFNNSLLLREKINKYVDIHINKKLKRYITFQRVDNSTLTGAALAVLLN